MVVPKKKWAQSNQNHNFTRRNQTRRNHALDVIKPKLDISGYIKPKVNRHNHKLD